MKEIVNHYYKTSFGSDPLISGLPLPDPDKGPYNFVRCELHPAVEDDLRENYSDSLVDGVIMKDVRFF